MEPFQIKSGGLNLASPSYVSWINALMITEQRKPDIRPWMAILTLEDGTRCNAAILSRNWVATSAHCVGSGKNFLVTVGTSNLSDKNALTLHGYQIVVHEEWDPQTYQNDIAIAKVESLPIAEKRGMVRIPAPGEFSPKPGTTSLIGNTWNEVRYPGVAYSNSLLEFPVEVLSLDLANRLLGMGPNSGVLQGSGTLNPEKTFASNSPLKSDAIITVEIDGDIFLIGIGSLPPPNTGTGSPSIHTYVPSYLDWLKNYLY